MPPYAEEWVTLGMTREDLSERVISSAGEKVIEDERIEGERTIVTLTGKRTGYRG